MLNKSFIKLLIITLSVFTYSISYAQDIELKPDFLKISKPFTSSGIAFLKVKNPSNRELVITKLYSPQARYVKLYKNHIGEDGFPEKMEIRSVNLRANNITQFADGRYQIILMGLKPETKQSNEVELFITFQDQGTYRTRMPVSI